MTLPAFMHFVQTGTLLTVPSTTMAILWTLGLKVLFVTLLEWLTLRPAAGCLPQMLQTLDIFAPSFCTRAADAATCSQSLAMVA